MFLVWVMQKTNKIFSNIFKGFVYLDKLYRTVPIGNFFAQQKLKNLVRCLYYSNQKEKQYLVFFKWYFSRYYSLLYFFCIPHSEIIFVKHTHTYSTRAALSKKQESSIYDVSFRNAKRNKKVVRDQGGGSDTLTPTILQLFLEYRKYRFFLLVRVLWHPLYLTKYRLESALVRRKWF